MDALWAYINERDEIMPPIVAQEGATFGQPTRKSIQQIFEAVNVPGNASIVDMGSGTGTVLFHLAAERLGESYHGIDFSEVLIHESEIRQRSIIPTSDITFYHDNILALTQDNLLTYASRNNGDIRHLVIYSFDSRMPTNVVNHIKDLVRAYDRGPITWITSFNERSLEQTDMRFVSSPSLMHIGPVGVTEDTPRVLYSRAEQSENYTEKQWEEIEAAEYRRAMQNVRMPWIDEDTPPPQLEEFQMYVYQRRGETDVKSRID